MLWWPDAPDETVRDQFTNIVLEVFCRSKTWCGVAMTPVIVASPGLDCAP